MEIKKCILTKNDCYKANEKITPKGIVVHSTGANNPDLRRYVAPDDGILGVNKYGNHWNKSGKSKCVHGFIGKDKNGEVRCYQTLPFDIACWGVGKGKKGSYNYNPAYIQFEICEDNLKNATYFEKAFNTAIDFCAYLCKEFDIPVGNIVSHKEAHQLGYGSNHGDCDHWLKKFGKDMKWFRAEVEKKLKVAEKPVEKSIDELAREVIAGKYGNGQARKNALGDKYSEVQKRVNELLAPPKKKTVDELAREVIAGKWGNGTDRKNRLTQAGYDYSAVQKRVNEILK